MKKLFVLLSLALSCISMNAEDLKTVVEQAIAHAKEQVAAGETSYEVAPVVLDKSVSYTLSSEIALDLQKVRINGCGATVTVTDAGQITTSTFLNITGVNFDCENATVAPIGMTKTPSADLKLKDQYPGANQDMFFNLNRITLDGCNFREVKNSVFTANGNNWALRYFDINDCIVQVSKESTKVVFDFKGSVKDLSITGNTIYSTTTDKFSKALFTMGNASNAQVQKSWGTDAIGNYKVVNNTICNFNEKGAGDQMPSKNNIIVSVKNNIFYNVYRFQNKFVGNCMKDYTVNENIQFSNLEPSTIESGLGVEVDPGFVAPTTALDFANVAALKANFANKVEGNSLQATYGDPRWAPIKVKQFANKNVEGACFELVKTPDLLLKDGVAADGKTGKSYINPTYSWVSYINPSSILTNNCPEVQVSARWTNLDPETGKTPTTGWGGMSVVGDNGETNCPVVGTAKSLVLYVTNATKVVVYGCSSSSTTEAQGNKVVAVATPTSGDAITAESGVVYGKSNGITSTANLELDPSKVYQIVISAAVADIQITGLNIYGVDSTPAPVFHAPVLAEDGAKYEVVLGPEMLEGNQVIAATGAGSKFGINPDMPWITYVRSNSSLLENGKEEVQTSNRGAKINPNTGIAESYSIVPVGEVKVCPAIYPLSNGDEKYMVFNVKGTATMRIFGTSSASGNQAENNRFVVTATSETNGSKATFESTPGGLYGKGTTSDVVVVDLDPAQKYQVVVKGFAAGRTIQIDGINLAPVALDGDALGNTTGINDINAAETVVKAKKYVKNGRIVIESANGTYSVTGAQLK